MDSAVAMYIDATYQKIRLIKSSDKSDVWLATDDGGTFVVIKQIFFKGLPYKTMKEISTPLCPKILYVSEDDNETVVIEEFIHGKSLADILKERGSLPETDIKNILLQLCDGLMVLHKNGIIHRDIKPSNLILEHGGAVRLIDFDAARTIKNGAKEDTRLLGTKGYAPPEQFGYGQTDERSDIYSLGVTMRKTLGEDYNGYLNRILSKCAEIDPAKRYQSAFDLKDAVLKKNHLRKKITVALSFAAMFMILFTPKYDDSQSTEAVNRIETAKAETKANAVKIESQAERQSKIENTVEKPKLEKSTVNIKTVAENKQPTSVSLAAAPKVTVKPPKPATASSANPIKGKLYINGQVYNKVIEIKRADWGTVKGTLKVTNGARDIWKNPKLKVSVKDNWGTKHDETLTLPPIHPGKTAEFAIPVYSYPVSDREPVHVWVQIYLDAGNLPVEESYWCAEFEIV